MAKTAKEMFEELGYEFLDPDENYILYTKETEADIITFEFDSELSDMFRAGEREKQNINIENPHWLSFEEVKATVQQMKELGWVE